MTTNFLKARFPSAEAAAQALPAVETFLRQGRQAHAWWKAHRHYETRGRRDAFWQQFQTLFPDVHACLGPLAGGECSDALLGFLEFGCEETTELRVEGKYLLLKAVVWRWADWDPLVTFFRQHFGAEGAAWIGDEPMDLFEFLDP